jgi:archaellum component FlaC
MFQIFFCDNCGRTSGDNDCLICKENVNTQVKGKIEKLKVVDIGEVQKYFDDIEEKLEDIEKTVKKISLYNYEITYKRFKIVLNSKLNKIEKEFDTFMKDKIKKEFESKTRRLNSLYTSIESDIIKRINEYDFQIFF